MELKFKKVFVSVIIKISPEGEILPLSIIFEDGKEYKINKLIYSQRAHATKVGGTGIRYTVVIGKQKTHLFEDEGRWFVEAKVVV